MDNSRKIGKRFWGSHCTFIIMIPFLIFAVILSQGKGAFLIAGYNTLPEQDKERFDEKALATFMGKVMYGYCFCLLLWGLNGLLQTDWLFIVGLILFIGLTVFTLGFSNTGNRLKK